MIELSVIIPHYNSPETLSKLLTSIPKKKNVQIIVVDDKSNKDLECLEKVKNKDKFKHITFLFNETNKKGAGICRNLGLEKALGKWILFADADDFFLEDFYSKISAYFRSSYDVVFFTPTSIVFDSNKKSDRHLKYEKIINNYSSNPSNEMELKLRYEFHTPCSKLISSEFIQNNKIRFDEVIAANDVMFSTRVGYYMKSFTVSKDIIYCITKGIGTLTTNTNVEVFDSRTIVHINYCKFLKERLDRRTYKKMNLHGMGILFNTIRFKYGFKKTVSVFFLFKKNNVNIFNSNFLNPIYVIRKFKSSYRRHLNNKKYLNDKKM